MSKRSDKHYKMESYSNNCYVYICMYGEKRDKLCDFSCIGTGKPCQNYVNAYWKISVGDIITRRKWNIQLRLLSSEKELVRCFVKKYSLWKLKDIIMQ